MEVYKIINKLWDNVKLFCIVIKSMSELWPVEFNLYLTWNNNLICNVQRVPRLQSTSKCASNASVIFVVFYYSLYKCEFHPAAKRWTQQIRYSCCFMMKSWGSKISVATILHTLLYIYNNR